MDKIDFFQFQNQFNICFLCGLKMEFLKVSLFQIDKSILPQLLNNLNLEMITQKFVSSIFNINNSNETDQ